MSRLAAAYRRAHPVDIRIRETDLTDPTCGLRSGLVGAPVVRAVQECLHAVLWNGTVGLAPLGHDLPAELAVVPLVGMAPSRVVVACNEGDTTPLIRSFIAIAAAAYRH